jgi:hypothetical protein
MISPDSNLLTEIELLLQYFTRRFTLSCNVNLSAKYSDGIIIGMGVNINGNHRVYFLSAHPNSRKTKSFQSI